MKKKLTIAIPTYNKCEFLKNNIEQLVKFIRTLGETSRVSFVISNNCSTDKTIDVLREIKESNTDIKFNIFHQDGNNGMCANFLFVIEKASSDYIMLLGDDDYIQIGYLRRILELIDSESDLAFIAPSYEAISVCGESLNNGRDLNIETKRYEQGFLSVLELSWRAHQMSGLVFRREGLYSACKNSGVRNIYIQIFLASYCAMHGISWHITNFPVKVTQMPQKEKGWGYGKDGLISDIFENYKKLGVSYIQRSKLEQKMLKSQWWRYTIYHGWARVRAAFLIAFGKNTTLLTGLWVLLRALKTGIRLRFRR